MYRGDRDPELAGAYIYSDYCDGRCGGFARTRERWSARGPLDVSVDGITAFGEGTDGELYVLSESEGLSKLVPG